MLQTSQKFVAVTGLRGLPGVMGGIETHCEELLPRLAALDPSIRITVLARGPYMPSAHSIYRDVEVVSVPSPRSQSVEAIASTFAGILHARRKGAHMIHIHAIGPALLAPLARLLGMKVITTHHGADYDRAKWGRFARLILRMGEYAGVTFSHSTICVSPSLAAMMQERYPRRATRIHYIPNGAPEMGHCDQSQDETLASMGLEKGKFILAVGRLVPEKGLDYLIAAVRASESGHKLVIAGANDHDSEYSRALLNQADQDIVFVGRQSRAVLRHLYEGAALFVLPSFHEGLPIAALEAGQSNTPMLLSDIQPNLDIGLPAHNYFPVGNVDALVKALRQPMENYAIDAQAIRARFNWDAIAQQTLTVYANTL